MRVGACNARNTLDKINKQVFTANWKNYDYENEDDKDAKVFAAPFSIVRLSGRCSVYT
jgi:hypothetical protein